MQIVERTKKKLSAITEQMTIEHIINKKVIAHILQILGIGTGHILGLRTFQWENPELEATCFAEELNKIRMRELN